jgi:hypothetical protein
MSGSNGQVSGQAAAEQMPDGEMRRLVDARRRAKHARGRGRFDGLITEAAVGRIIGWMGWRRIDPADPPPCARRIFDVIDGYQGLKVGRNSDVEGLYDVEGLERLLHVEATGAFAASDTEKVGLRRSDSAHKINSRIPRSRRPAIRTNDAWAGSWHSGQKQSHPSASRRAHALREIASRVQEVQMRPSAAPERVPSRVCPGCHREVAASPPRRARRRRQGPRASRATVSVSVVAFVNRLTCGTEHCRSGERSARPRRAMAVGAGLIRRQSESCPTIGVVTESPGSAQ